MQIKNLVQFEAFTKQRIPSRAALFQGDLGLRRMKYFMRMLGNPQNKLKVIHVAGTSGKGSTCYLTSHLLESQGFKVGLSISPHIFDIRERMQINNTLPGEKIILKYFNEILPTILEMEKTKYGSPTFFEINVGLAFYIFAKEKLDYAVMETGLGGLLDATNCASSNNKVCLITPIGLDHTEILGKTISQIAQQKAGIIQNLSTVITNQSSVIALKILEDACKGKNASLQIVGEKNYRVISSSPKETVFDFYLDNYKFKEIELGLIGKHQAQNCSTAIACLASLSKRDKFIIDEKLLRSSLRNIQIPGRFEIKKLNGKTLIIDGAHNRQKMLAFTSNLAALYPNQKFTFVVAFKKGKDYQSMLKLIIPLAAKIYLAGFSASKKQDHLSSIKSKEIAAFLQSQNFYDFKMLGNTSNLLINLETEKKPIVITGSLYLASSILSCR